MENTCRMATFYCKQSAPVKLETGEVLLLKQGMYLLVDVVTEQISKYVSTGVLIRRNVPDGSTVIVSKGVR